MKRGGHPLWMPAAVSGTLASTWEDTNMATINTQADVDALYHAAMKPGPIGVRRHAARLLVKAWRWDKRRPMQERTLVLPTPWANATNLHNDPTFNGRLPVAWDLLADMLEALATMGEAEA